MGQCTRTHIYTHGGVCGLARKRTLLLQFVRPLCYCHREKHAHSSYVFLSSMCVYAYGRMNACVLKRKRERERQYWESQRRSRVKIGVCVCVPKSSREGGTKNNNNNDNGDRRGSKVVMTIVRLSKGTMMIKLMMMVWEVEFVSAEKRQQ